MAMSNKSKRSRKYRNSKKSKRTRRNHKVRRSCRKSGGCGCDRLFGGSANLQGLPEHYYYKYNSDLSSDPTAPANMVDSRLAGDFSRTNGGGVGGRRRRRLSKKQRCNKMRGGSSFFTGISNQIHSSGSGHNFLTSLGVPNGYDTQNSLLSGTGGIINSSIT